MRTSLRPGRRGAATLVILGALLALLVVGVLVLQQATRTQYRDAHRYTRGEVAMNLAQSGLNLGWEHLLTATGEPGTRLHQVLVEAVAGQVEVRPWVLASPHLEGLVAILGDQARLEVRLEVRDVRPLLEGGGLAGIQHDPREKVGRLALVAAASYGGIRRSLVASRGFRVVGSTLPVLSKFTLFVRERPQDPNLLDYDRLRPLEDPSRGGRPARPLVLFHRRERFPAVVDGQFAALGTTLEGVEPDAGGLVYLGGRPWALNATHGPGAGPYEELHLFRRTRYEVPPTLPGARREAVLFFGSYRGLFQSPLFGTLRVSGGYQERPGGPVLTDRTAALHLMGDISAVSPTVVLGPVSRRHVEVRLADGRAFPGRREGEGVPAGFPGDYAVYRQYMPHVVEEPYNRAWDYLISNFETAEGDGRVEFRPTDVRPPATLGGAGLRRVRPAAAADAGYLYPEPGEDAPGACELVRVGASDEVIFRGALADLDPEVIRKLIEAKAAWVVRDQAAFEERFVRGTDLRLPGVVLLESGGLTLGGLNVREAGIVAASGPVTITGPLVQARAGQPLTVVSLDGDVVVTTGAKVDAHLVALRGALRSRGGLRVVGGVAVGSLDLEQIVGGAEPKTITYDPALDPTEAAIALGLLRLHLDEEVRLRIEG